jgi:hypothetical protein
MATFVLESYGQLFLFIAEESIIIMSFKESTELGPLIAS